MGKVDPSGEAYDAAGAARYAKKWAESHNPKYRNLGGEDCTNFVSQCLREGGGKSFDKMGALQWYWNWKYSTSTSWNKAHELYRWLKSEGGSQVFALTFPGDNTSALRVGDVVFYDWDANGQQNHAALCTGTGTSTEGPYGKLIAQHSIPSDRPRVYLKNSIWN